MLLKLDLIEGMKTKLNKPYRVLVFGMTPNPGGVESFLMNYYKKINKDKIHFDFLCNTHEKISFEDEIKELGGKIFKISMRSKHPLRYKYELKKFFNNNSQNYDCIWINVNSLANIDYLKMAKKCGIKRRIIHSHNSKNMDSRLRGLLHDHNKKIIKNYATDFWACSSSAAEWFYSNDLMPRVKIIKNAIDLNDVKFDLRKRQSIRKKYNLDDNFVIGNVGRLHFQKNQTFAIDILNVLIRKNKKIKLVLVGDGPDKSALVEKVKKLKLENYVLFTGVQTNINEWLSAFDLFLFPSRFEGLSIAGLEAEANGLPVLAAKDGITTELKINDNFKFLSLKEPAYTWANEINNNIQNYERTNQKKIIANFKKSGYDINSEVKKLESLFIGENEEISN